MTCGGSRPGSPASRSWRVSDLTPRKISASRTRESGGSMALLRIDDFTDPGCPFAFSAEPARMRLRWLYGDQIEWRPRMIVLSRHPSDYLRKGLTPEKLAVGMA